MSALKVRKTFDEVIDFVQNDKTKIKYPDRKAKFLRHSFELSQLDGVGMILMEQQQLREMKQREKEHLLRQLVSNTSKSTTEERASQQSETQYTRKLRRKRHHQGLYINPQLNHLLLFHN